MTLHRFKLLRRCLSFNAVPTTLDEDAAARIRPVPNLPKIIEGWYLHVGRDVTLDEASVACRSRQGLHMIVYNPMKPTGKYHFRLYMVCCSTTWIALNYKLHCNRSDILNRLGGVVDPLEAQSLREELDVVSKIRQHVLEVTRPLFGTNRIVNMDGRFSYSSLSGGKACMGAVLFVQLASTSQPTRSYTKMTVSKENISRLSRTTTAFWLRRGAMEMV
ncbi:unnamed protein product [Phytophthora fragariaefolia]|uniref:Unnamed protein product n=1 Tax=Phytophthora fragariaefolia TaxID=1490495 RepID=A0A9W6UE85_9STRA|nr:unnamed protein product [Phytophthora fragariaefolia]